MHKLFLVKLFYLVFYFLTPCYSSDADKIDINNLFEHSNIEHFIDELVSGKLDVQELRNLNERNVDKLMKLAPGIFTEIKNSLMLELTEQSLKELIDSKVALSIIKVCFFSSSIMLLKIDMLNINILQNMGDTSYIFIISIYSIFMLYQLYDFCKLVNNEKKYNKIRGHITASNEKRKELKYTITIGKNTLEIFLDSILEQLSNSKIYQKESLLYFIYNNKFYTCTKKRLKTILKNDENNYKQNKQELINKIYDILCTQTKDDNFCKNNAYTYEAYIPDNNKENSIINNEIKINKPGKRKQKEKSKNSNNLIKIETIKNIEIIENICDQKACDDYKYYKYDAPFKTVSNKQGNNYIKKIKKFYNIIWDLRRDGSHDVYHIQSGPIITLKARGPYLGLELNESIKALLRYYYELSPDFYF